jgi:tetratricopeptide (TPR) repeat protein
VTYAVQAAARLAGVSEQRVRHLIRIGRIAADRVGGRMVLSFSEVARLKQLGRRSRRHEVAASQLPLELVFPVADVVLLTSPAPPPVRTAGIDAMRERALVLEARDVPSALALYREIAAETDDPDDWAMLLAGLHEHGLGREAMILAKGLRERFAGSAVIQFNCGVVWHGQKRFAEAVVAYEAALALDSDFSDAHRYLHECYEALGQQQLAIRHASAWLRGGDSDRGRG